MLLFDSMGSRLLAYSISFGIPVQDGEDVIQETFLALFQHLKQGRSRENLKGWLYRVTHNLSLKHRMRRAAGPTAFDITVMDQADSGLNPEESALWGERHSSLRAALHGLPLLDQSCLRLRADGLRYREIAAILGISLGSVSASLSRSVMRMERVNRRLS